MAGGDDDYGEAFKKAKLEHDQQLETPTEAKRLQAEADADIAVLSNVVLLQLQVAAQKLHPLGGKVEIRQYGRTGKTLRPASIAFRITDQQDQQDQPGYGKGHQSRAYLIVPRGGVVTVTCGDGFDVTGQPKQPKNVSEEIGIQRREDVTIENVKNLTHVSRSILARLIVCSDVVALRGLSHALRPHSAATLTTHTGTL
jgi:hypothetical protein